MNSNNTEIIQMADEHAIIPLLQPCFTDLAFSGIPVDATYTRNQASLKVAVEHRQLVHRRLFQHLSRLGKNGIRLVRGDSAELVRGQALDFVVGWNLDPEQLAASICATISTDGLCINIR